MMRKQNKQVIEFIRQNFGGEVGSYKEKKFGKSLEVLVRHNAFKIYMYKTCLVSYSDISHDVIFDCGNYHTVSTAQNLKAFVEGIFGFVWKSKWKGIIDNYGQEYTRERNGKIYIQPISNLYL